MFVLKFLFCVLLVHSNTAQDYINYPSSSLQCYSYLTKPDRKLICPAARNTWCVKEVVGLQQDLCGKTQYFGDHYSGSFCALKMCAAECVPGTYSFLYAGNYYSRTRYCCNDKNFCNSASAIIKSSYSKFYLCFFVLFVTMLIYVYS